MHHVSVFSRTLTVAAIAALTVTGAATTASAQTSSPRDIMFSIDSTGSMSGYINQVKLAVDDMATDLASPGSGARVGLAEYRDAGDIFQARTVTDLTTDVSAFSADLNALSVDGGGDTPESVYSGIAVALCQSWTQSGVGAVIAIGDAPAKDPEPVTGLTAEKVIALAKGTSTDNPYCPAAAARAYADAGPAALPGGGVKVFVVSEHEGLLEQLQEIAAATGGATVPVENVDEISEAIKDTVGGIDTGDGGLFGSLEGSLEKLFGSAGN